MSSRALRDTQINPCPEHCFTLEAQSIATHFLSRSRIVCHSFQRNQQACGMPISVSMCKKPDPAPSPVLADIRTFRHDKQAIFLAGSLDLPSHSNVR